MGLNVCEQKVRLTRDIEVKTTSGGKSYARFSAAADTGFGENKKSNFYNYVAFGKTAENLARFFGKRSEVIIISEPQQNTYTNKDGDKISEIVFIVKEFDFCGKREESTTSASVQSGSDNGFMDVPDGADEGVPFN